MKIILICTKIRIEASATWW